MSLMSRRRFIFSTSALLNLIGMGWLTPLAAGEKKVLRPTGLILIPTMSESKMRNDHRMVFTLDLETDEVRQWSVPLLHLHSGVFVPGNRHALLVEKDGNRMCRLSLASGESSVLETKPGWVFSGHCLFSPEGQSVLTSEYFLKDPGRSQIVVRDPVTLAETSRFDSGGVHAHELVWSTQGERLMVGHYGREPGPQVGDIEASVTELSYPEGKLLKIYRSASEKNLSLCHLRVNSEGGIAVGTINAIKRENLNSQSVEAGLKAGQITEFDLLAGPVLFKNSQALEKNREADEILDQMIRVGSVAVDRRGEKVLMSHVNGKMVSLWEMHTGRLIHFHRFKEDRPTGVVLTGDGSHFLVASSRGRFHLFHAETLKKVKSFSPLNGKMTSNFHLAAG